jgi:chemotaxis protein CheD
MEVRVRIADYAVGGSGVSMITVGLGSCVAIVLHDAVSGLGSLAHCLLPDRMRTDPLTNAARYPREIVPVMVRELRSRGSKGALVAKLIGGASMFKSLMNGTGTNVGERNVMAARDALAAAGIPITAEDTGGESGRSLRYNVDDGSVLVRTIRGGERVL